MRRPVLRHLLVVLVPCVLPFVLQLSQLTSAGVLLADDDQQRLQFFEQKIRPVLVQHCYKCHSAQSVQVRGGLLVDSRAGLLQGGDSGPAVVPGDITAGQLLSALRHESVEMPPDRRLPDAVIQDFQLWIQDGAVDPREGQVREQRPQIDLEQGRQFWSFRPVQNAVVPDAGADWARGSVDRFLAAGWTAGGIPGTPRDAAPETLLRRLHFVLTGLQPSVDEQRQFQQRYQQDPEGVLQETVDQLLQSPHFGERWGRHWLDVVRYADSTGGGRSMMLPDAWRFRDYVIRSFQQDKPFPQLIREHLAGDLLPAVDAAQHDEQVTGAGYLMLGAINYEEQDKEQLRMDVVDEQIDTVGRTFLGMTLSCARCHDHKFDPIPTHDYYALAGIFRSTRSLTPGNVCGWVTRPLQTGVDQAAVLAWNQRDQELADQIAQLKKQAGKQPAVALPGIVVDDDEAELEGTWTESKVQQPFLGRGYRHSGMPRTGTGAVYRVKLPADGEYLLRMVVNHGSSRTENVPVVIFHADGETEVGVSQRQPGPQPGGFLELGRYRFEAATEARVVVRAAAAAPGHVIIDAFHFVPADQIGKLASAMPATAAAGGGSGGGGGKANRLKQLEEARKQHAAKKPAMPIAMCVSDEPQTGDWHLHVRGEIRNLGPVVRRGFLQVATPADQAVTLSSEVAGSGRLQLAEWLAGSQNPLTSRVWANRIWLNVFGAGLVRTPDNFGSAGEPPTHPELLDHLAWQLMHECGWSTKAMVRRLVLSRAFRMTSDDGMLSAELDPDNRLWTRANRRRLDAESLRDAILQAAGSLDLSMTGGPTIARVSTYDNEYRHADYPLSCRSVYVPAFRNSMLDLFEIFDAANPNTVTGQRNRSTRPAQALYMLNSQLLTQQSEQAAKNFLASAGSQSPDVSAMIELAVRRCLGRQPLPGEQQLLLQAVQSDPGSAENWAAVFQALFSSLDFRFID
ncbi:MAG: DUF1553 domain-containing protein [Planctomyces sp.]